MRAKKFHSQNDFGVDSMKFAFFIPYFRDGGVETTTVRLARQLSQRGHETDLVTFQHDSPYLKDSPFRTLDLDARRTLTSIPKLVRYLRRERPDVVISAHHFANIIAVVTRSLSRTDPELVVTERLQISHVLSDSDNPKDRLLPPLMRLTYPRADHIVTVSRDAGDALADIIGVPPDSIDAIYNATLVDEVFDKAEEPLNHPWFQDDNMKIVLGVGRLKPQKDFESLIRAFAQVRAERDDVRLVVLGEGDRRPALESLAEDLGVADAIDLNGFVDNPYVFMQNADVFVLSSRYEGMPNVLVEAAALGTPVVATDCPSGPRELLNDGEGGELVSVGDVNAMAEAITYQLDHPTEARERLEGIQDNLAEFRPEQTVKRYLELVERGDE